ncbi:Outer spore coat protein E (CotE) [Planifilum fulgidum]|uniref:Outer spore coat protein E (CotE) n=1 Tax=Planifilum fulgidum TaxID=201973 RepID=A0A1I2MIA1_9BACL|nr:Outer spore coat protein E (CotE) [Planifilum fulgidum]
MAARLGVGGIHPVDVLPPQIPLKWGNPTGIHRGFRPGEGPRIPGHTAGNIPIWSMSANRRFHVNIWYSYDGNTKTDVAKETIRYVERVPLSYYDRNVR